MSQPPQSGVLDGRNYLGLGEADLRAAIDAVKQYFGEQWLLEHPDHPVGRNWSRPKDFMASNELFWFGYSILRLRNGNETWLRKMVARIKSESRNERIGYMFELFALATLTGHGQTVKPAPFGAPDYDGDLFLPTGEHYRVSIKNFGASNKDREFRKHAKEVERIILKTAGRMGLSWLSVVIVVDEYPRDPLWPPLIEALPAILRRGGKLARVGPWTIIKGGNPPATPHSIDPDQLSHSFMIAAPHHKNEAKSFIDKIERQGLLDFEDAARSYGPNIRAVPFIRLSEQASIDDCVRWAQDYLNEPKRCIDAVVLYQAAVAVNVEQDTTSLHHNVGVALSPKHQGPLFNMEVPVGLVSQNPSRGIIFAGEQQLSLDGHHWYGSNEVYQLSPMTEDGATMDMRASMGMARHAVLVGPDGSKTTFSMQQRDHDDVWLFT